jgi:transposase-like protein
MRQLGDLTATIQISRMTCYQEITCPACGGNHITKSGLSALGSQRYRCQNPDCPTKTFMLNYRYKAYEPGVKERVVEMAINSSGVRDTARVLKISKGTVISTLKKKRRHSCR